MSTETTQTAESEKKLSLIERLAKETENKTPGAETSSINEDFFKKEQEKKNGKFKEAEIVKDEKGTKDTKAPNEATSTETKNTTENKDETTTTKKPTKAIREASARTAVGMVNLGLKIILTPVVNHKFKKKFTDKEVTKLDDSNIVDCKKDDLVGDDLALRNKWDRLFKRAEKLKGEIPLKPDEEQDLMVAAGNYMEIKEKELPPEWFLYMAAANIIGKRVIDVVFD